jgi:hypothetical protein
VIHGKESHVCRLKKALYGLKQVPRAWYARIDNYLMRLGFTKSDAYPNLYYKVENGCLLILVLYVDDLFLTGYEKLIVKCKREITSEFEMKDLGLMHYLLGLEAWQRSDDTFLRQGKYIVEILQRFEVRDCKSMTTPMTINMKLLSDSSSDLVNPMMYTQLIGSLMYLVNTRPNIYFAVNALSQCMIEPRHVHWMTTKHMLRYLRGTIGYGLRYISGGDVKLQGYTKFVWAGNTVDQKSTFRCCFSMGSIMISWLNRKQTSMALSTTKAEYIVASVESRESMWLRKSLARIFDL